MCRALCAPLLLVPYVADVKALVVRGRRRQRATEHAAQSVAARMVREVCGYPVETFSVRTADGYILRLVRIARKESRRVAYFQHGLLDSASAWVANGAVYSLACRAYQQGFDVFMGNFRGTNDSMGEEPSMLLEGEHDERGRVQTLAHVQAHDLPTSGAERRTMLGHVRFGWDSVEFWRFSVEDHALDMIAHVQKVHQPRENRRTERARDGLDYDDDIRVVGVGHSMGGCISLLHILHCRALGIPHGLSGAILLSPAGLHEEVGVLPRLVLNTVSLAIHSLPDGPFPVRSSIIQRTLARLLQDLKRGHGTGELMAALATLMFGGRSSKFAFKHIAFTDYPIGGTCQRVMRHGIQNMMDREFQSYDYGEAENTRRYGQPRPPSYRDFYSLIDVPVHFIAGGRDELIPPSNLRKQAAALSVVQPTLASFREFTDAGHLDFTLGMDDDVICEVVDQLQRLAHRDPRRRLASPAALPFDPAAVVDACAVLRKRVLASRRALRLLPTDGARRPARDMARRFPFLAAYTKREEAWLGLDMSARGQP